MGQLRDAILLVALLAAAFASADEPVKPSPREEPAPKAAVPGKSREAIAAEFKRQMGASLRLISLKEHWLLGENIILYYEVTNDGDKPLVISYGGDHRGAPRATRFRVTAVDADGKPAADPHPNPNQMGGILGGIAIKPGETGTLNIPLGSYRNLDRPGRYVIRAAHDLGWKAEDSALLKSLDDADDPRWTETVIEVAMPTELEARSHIEAILALKAAEPVPGKRHRPFVDFSALRYPVYLPMLRELSHKHYREAVEGIAGIPTPEATTALIELLTFPDEPLVRHAVDAARTKLGMSSPYQDESISDEALRALRPRLPHPGVLAPDPPAAEEAAFLDEVEVRSGGISEREMRQARRDFIAATWRPELAEPVRKFARRVLAESPIVGLRDSRLESTAYLLECVATPEEHAAVVSALDRVLIFSAGRPLESPLTYGTINALLQCSNQLKIAPPADPKSAAEIAIYLQAAWRGGKHAPADFVERCSAAFGHPVSYVRRLALEALPQPAPAWALDKVAELLASPDVGVRRAATIVVVNSGDARFRENLLSRMAVEQDEWVLRELDQAADRVGVPLDKTLEAWAARLNGPKYDRAQQRFTSAAECFNLIRDRVIDYHGGSSWSGHDTNPAGDDNLDKRWLNFIGKNRAALARGEKFRIGDPELDPRLFPAGASVNHEGKLWPPQRLLSDALDEVE